MNNVNKKAIIKKFVLWYFNDGLSTEEIDRIMRSVPEFIKQEENGDLEEFFDQYEEYLK